MPLAPSCPSCPPLQYSARFGLDKIARGWLARSLGLGADGLNGLGLKAAQMAEQLASTPGSWGDRTLVEGRW
jgi:hypothetical protein